ncbi:MAG TPA: flagellar filament capping protein FliD [Acidobacteriota bacterium]|nr:flagellar filament capping protein FliD [Acidobacteriota bacterium]
MSSPINIFNGGLDVGSIVDNLINVESAPIRTMQSQVAAFQSRINAYQNLNSTMSALSNSINRILFGSTEAPLLAPGGFEDRLATSIFAANTVASSDDNVVSATAVNATAGRSYSITVNSIAQAASAASSGFRDTTSHLTGTGALVITAGGKDPVTIEINETNNTLQGVARAINSAGAGIAAAIINDGSGQPFRLLLTSRETGVANDFTVEEQLSGGQSFAFLKTQNAADASFVLNGINITKSSNVVSDAIGGITFTLKQTSPHPVAIRIENDTDAVVGGLNEFISAYNAVNSFINNQFAYNTATSRAGTLSGDSTLRRIQSDLQTRLTQSVANDLTNFRVAAQIGIDFNRDGSLSLNETRLREVLRQDTGAVAALLLGQGNPQNGATFTDNRVGYAGQTSATLAGTYDIYISSPATRASATGARPVDTLSDNETLSITHDGVTIAVELTQNDSLETVLGKINTALSAQGVNASASDDGTGRIMLTTAGYGSARTISVVSDRADEAGSAGFGTTPVIASGSDIAGAINGAAAVGSGLTLTGAAGRPEEGLRLNIAQTETGYYGTATVTVADANAKQSGIFMNLRNVLRGITDPLSGPIHHARDALDQNIRRINDQIRQYEERLETRRDILMREFLKADEALKLLEVTQASITNQINSLKQT